MITSACKRERPVPAAAAADPVSAAPNPSAPSAPSTYRARFETSAGVFVIEVQRDWAPRGADRFYELVKSGYFDGQRFFRVLSGFMAQFGIHGYPKSPPLAQRNYDDRAPEHTRGMESLRGPNTSHPVFINYATTAR